ncbi:MFS general substrate transporter [Aspergillus steynii IBT 23096]|uniref:MFS general substrate transporter n=1 Tax=Aspergillus steynii IBT 23096 TaxID=1392250 RepID=A0A2I2G840_9EURO|nr:MFS general substrate transporter [Aspergillus steynii IBT 23096]PLB49013.1 MFS general substrate transporter [Aspergillus steynii IBT 23096]
MTTVTSEPTVSLTDEKVEQNSSIQPQIDKEDAEFGPAPDGGMRAWLVAAGGSCLFFCCLGFSNSFGAFQEYYLRNQLRGESPDRIAWIGSLSVFLQFGAGMIGGPLFDRFGAKVIRPAAVVYIFAMMMLSLCKTFWQIILVQGVLMGIAMGLLQIPACAAVFQYFDKKRAVAIGVVVSGSSLGGIVMPIAISKMLNNSSLGFGWSVRIIGFLIMPFMAFAIVTVKARLPSRTTKFWISEAYQDPKFIILIISMFFTFIGIFTPIFYIPTYAVTRGMGPTLAGYMPAILNAASTFGRIIPGLLADKYGRLNLFALGGIVTGVIIFCMDSATTNAGLIVYSAAFGFTSGSIISGASAAISLCTQDPRDMGTYMGMGTAISALGVLIGPPVSGVIVEHYQGFFEVSMISGAMCLFGGFVGLMTKLATPQGMFGRV